jgi:hypothetical protein
MMPSAFVPFEELPLTPAEGQYQCLARGGEDRRRTEEAAKVLATGEDRRNGGRSLGRGVEAREVAAEDNFWLGGHSLLATRVGSSEQTDGVRWP